MTIRLHSAFNPAFQDAWHGFARLYGRFSVRCDGVFVFLCVSLRHEKSVACSSGCSRHGGLPARRGRHCGSALADYAFSLAGCGALLPKFAPALRPFAGTPTPRGLHPAFPRGAGAAATGEGGVGQSGVAHALLCRMGSRGVGSLALVVAFAGSWCEPAHLAFPYVAPPEELTRRAARPVSARFGSPSRRWRISNGFRPVRRCGHRTCTCFSCILSCFRRKLRCRRARRPSPGG